MQNWEIDRRDGLGRSHGTPMDIEEDVVDRGRIVIVGGGPVGSVLALATARIGFEVTLIEADEEIDENPRAATFHASTIEMIASLGMGERFLERGLVARHFDYWDRPTGRLVARMDHEVLRNDTAYPFAVQLEQHVFVRIFREALNAHPNVTQLIGWRATDIAQDADGVDVTVVRGDESEVLRAHWAVGADGGRSTVRKALDIEFEGYTWPTRFLVLTTQIDLQQLMPISYRGYMADPENWLALFKVRGRNDAGWWRMVSKTSPDASDDEAMSDSAVSEHVSQLLGGDDPQLVHRKVYNVHQRVAKSFRSNRIFLAGDSAHVNNPLGGLGLNGGIHDAMELTEILEIVGTSTEDEALLNRYERRRRTLNIEFIQAQTIENKTRLEETDPAVRSQRLAELTAIAEDPVRAREYLRRTSLLQSVDQAKQIN